MNHPITLYSLLRILHHNTQVEIIRHMGGNIYDFVADGVAGTFILAERKPICAEHEVQKAVLHNGDEGMYLEIIVSAK